MTLLGGTDGMLHPPDGGLHDHHAAPAQVTISNTTQSLPPGTTYNLDITLPRSDYQLAKILVYGPTAAVGAVPANSGYEGAFITATTDAGDAMGYCGRDAGAFRQYGSCMSKQEGSTNLTDYIFDANTGLGSSYERIAVQSAQIIGAVLRLVMHNRFGGSATLWIKGAAVLL